MDYSFLKLHWPFSLMICGSSGCGKTTLTIQIVENINEYSTFTPEKIYLIYSEMQPLYRELRSKSPCPVVLVQGLDKDFEPPPRCLLIIDDLQNTGDKDVIRQLFTVKSHHKNVSVLYLVQNLFDKDPRHRTISLNANYIALFRNPRDASQIVHLAKQMRPDNPGAMQMAYKHATKQPHSYLFLDLRQATPDWARLRTSVGPVSKLIRSFVYCERNDLEAVYFPLRK